MNKLRVTHLEIGYKDFNRFFFLRFTGPSDLFHEVCEALKANHRRPRYRAHWDPDYRWDDGKVGAWCVSDVKDLFVLSYLFSNMEGAVKQAYDRENERQFVKNFANFSGTSEQARSFVPVPIRAALKTLNLEPHASQEEIKRAFRKQAMQHHPDRHMQASLDERQAHENAFKQIKKAYELVSAWVEV